MSFSKMPKAQGLYDPSREHDACGVGFVVNIKGQASHQILRDSLTVLVNLAHRGAVGCEPNTGDGAGVLLQLPHKFLAKVAQENGFNLPEAGDYGVGFAYLAQDEAIRAGWEKALENIITEEGQVLLGWRDVPTDNSALGNMAISCEPYMRLVFVGRSADVERGLPFERKLYLIRQRAEHEIKSEEGIIYFPSFSSRTICYKGMLIGDQLDGYYADLSDPDVETAIAIVHSRFSTNTFPSWERAHPYRYIIHNGEINTLRGNVNWMRARQSMFASDVWGADIDRVIPVIDEAGSDSAMFDNCLEFLSLSGRSLPHSAMMMIPEPWQNHEAMSDEKKAFYEFHASLMEPWDGPSSIAFTDGTYVGAVLDRNGLRPSRYYVTTDDRIIMASEVGVLDIAPEMVKEKGRLQPGRMFLVDTAAGRIINDEELKNQIAAEYPYREWLKDNLVALEDLPAGESVPVEETSLIKRQQAFGYTYEDINVTLEPMGRDGVEPLGSMGTDTPLAVLSERPQLLYSYFKQLFAQVTNPPIDSIREEIITATETTIGPERNLLKPEPLSCRQIKLHYPVITDEELARLKAVKSEGLTSITLSTLYDPKGAGPVLEQAMDTLCAAASKAIDDGYGIIILSDRGVNDALAPIPALLAVAGVHHHLVREGSRTRVGLVLESGEPREVHHFAVLIGYGAGAINPYLAIETLKDMCTQGLFKTEMCPEKVEYNYIKAAVKGVVKTMSKMGISTIQSYRGAQIFEALGLSSTFISKYFTGTSSRIEGIGISEVAAEAAARHDRAFASNGIDSEVLDPGGLFKWRVNGEDHLYNPESIHLLQQATSLGDYNLFKRYSCLLNDETRDRLNLRGLLQIKASETAIPIDEVEPVSSIVQRFKTGAMSYGSISQEAHETLAIAMNRLNGKSNTGEGGEDPARYIPDSNGDSRCSAIKQVASGRFGVTSEYLVNAREIQIKMAQGAKPGEGGQLPGTKVYPWVARTRHSTPGVGLISPPPHHDIYSIEDLAELIHDLKNANQDARISVKLVSEVGVGTIAAGVVKAHADVVLISGYDGGTGASPQSSLKHAGLPWELGLAETHQTLLLNDLRSRVVVETDGKLMTGRDVVIAALLGAEEFGFATAPLVTMGCVMMRVCQLDTCPTGVATQNPELRKCFIGKPEYVINFMEFVAQEIREYMAQMGFRSFDDMVGRVDMLDVQEAVDHWKASGVDLSAILFQPEVGENVGGRCMMPQDHGIDVALDRTQLLEACKPALENAQPVKVELPIRNVNRVVGTILGSEVTKRYGAQGLPEDTIQLKFTGSAGQSFGAFVPKGITLELEGDSNDYIGKGLSGGKMIVYSSPKSTFVAEDNIIIGNVAFYGATSGEAYIGGMAGERFCVRNSGVTAVVESVGDHGCEYMTGGCVVVLGKVGRNFAAGMSGGVAYVMDEDNTFVDHCNTDMVGLSAVEDADELAKLKSMVEKHVQYTKSAHGKKILDNWAAMAPKFVKVYPHDYRRMMEAIQRVTAEGLSGDEAIMAAFEANRSDTSRIGGN